MLRGTIIYELFQLLGYWRKTHSSKEVAHQRSEQVSFGPHPSQYLVIYSPKKPDPSKPLIVYYHGGGWIFGKPDLFVKKAALFTQLGYQVIMPSYRKVPRFDSDHILEDASLMLTKLHLLHQEGKIRQLDRILLGGVSAGANLVSLIYFQQSLLKKAGFRQEQFCGMFLYAPPMDLSKMTQTPVLYRFAGKPKSAQFERTSPINFLANSRAIPILCVHGEKDGLVKHAASQTFKQLYESLHPQHLTYRSLKDCTHLEVVSWAHTDNDLRKDLVAWLLKVS